MPSSLLAINAFVPAQEVNNIIWNYYWLSSTVIIDVGKGYYIMKSHDMQLSFA